MTANERKLVKAAKQTMELLKHCAPLTPHGNAWDALHAAVKQAERKPARRK